MKYNLFLDDVRHPHQYYDLDWVIARSFLEAVKIIEEKGCPNYISFDHDLGITMLTGHDLAKWIIDKDLDNPGFIPEDFIFNVHSANPVGTRNIEELLNNYLRFRNELQIKLSDPEINALFGGTDEI